MQRGKFITLEGGEGAGKSTQARLLHDFLQSSGVESLLTREVGGCPSAEDIRELWLHKGEQHWDGLTEILLISAARREHLTHTIWPNLDKGVWVISDRFVDSTRAYQGQGLGLGQEVVDRFYREIADHFEPDLTLLLDLPVEVSLARMVSRGGQDDRYQQKNAEFHKTLRKAYLDLMKQYPARIKHIDATGDLKKVAASVVAVVQQRFDLKS